MLRKGNSFSKAVTNGVNLNSVEQSTFCIRHILVANLAASPFPTKSN